MSEITLPKSQHSRKFNGKLSGFESKDEKNHEKAHLKAYLKGRQFYRFGFDLSVNGSLFPREHITKEETIGYKPVDVAKQSGTKKGSKFMARQLRVKKNNRKTTRARFIQVIGTKNIRHQKQTI